MASDKLGILRPSIYRFRLGDFELTSLLDGVMLRDGPYPKLGANASAEEMRALMEANRLPSEQMEHGFVPTLLNTGRELVLFDTGNGEPRRNAQMGRLRELIQLAGHTPEEIDVVVITHGHPDHIYGLHENGMPAYPNARYVFGRVEFDFWSKGEHIPEQRMSNREDFVRMCLPLADRATFVEPGDEIVPGVHTVEAYGHSAGHMAYHVESEGHRLLIWADTVIHYVASLQAPDWHVAVDDDKERAAETRRRILDMVVTEKLWVAGFHMPFPAIGFVETVGNRHRWIPATYQLNL